MPAYSAETKFLEKKPPERLVELADASFFVASSMLLPILPGVSSSTHSDIAGNKIFKPFKMPEYKMIVRIELGMNTKTAQRFVVD